MTIVHGAFVYLSFARYQSTWNNFLKYFLLKLNFFLYNMENLDIEYIILKKVQEYPNLYKKNLPQYVDPRKDEEAWDETASYISRLKRLPAFSGLNCIYIFKIN